MSREVFQGAWNTLKKTGIPKKEIKGIGNPVPTIQTTDHGTDLAPSNA